MIVTIVVSMGVVLLGRLVRGDVGAWLGPSPVLATQPALARAPAERPWIS